MQDWAPAEANPIPLAPLGDATRGGPTREWRRKILTDVLRREILPRLIEAQRIDGRALARDVLAARLDRVREAVAARLAAGATAYDVMRQDLAAAARHLGELWACDDIDFLDVTLALGALGELLRELTPREGAGAASAPSLVLAPAPGEAHYFGADVAAHGFRQAGWRVLRCDFDAALSALAGGGFDACGLSLSCESGLASLPAAIAAARAAARNPRLAMIVGGPVFATRPALARECGADFCAAERDMAPHFPHGIARALRL